MIKRKPDADKFKTHLQKLRQIDWLDATRAWWPRFVFHFTDIHNVVSILRIGELLSRQIATQQSQFVDIASPAVISATLPRWYHYVRFYMRPRTPTLYRNEGLRPQNNLPSQAHCPIPIYLLFDFVDVVTRSDALFTDGNLASNQVHVASDAAEFIQLPFQFIYHDTFFKPEERDKIIFHRHAEVIVPNRIGLTSLQYIWCRSQAEKDALRHLLPMDIWQKWRDRIFDSNKRELFFRNWFYLERVTLTNQQVTLSFNRPAHEQDTGPFHIHIEITETRTGKQFTWSQNPFYITNKMQSFNLTYISPIYDYTIRITIDDHLVYLNRYQESDMPF